MKKIHDILIKELERGNDVSIISEIDKLFAEKKLPLKKQAIQNNQTLYQGSFMVYPGKRVPFGLVIVNGEGVVDFQINFKKITYLTNYSDKEKVLELINDLNMQHTFYYKLGLAGDGEIMMKTMAKTTEDIRPMYEMLIVGSNILKQVVTELEKMIPATEK